MQLGVRDVAGILNVSEKTVYRWIQQGQLPAYRVNDQYRFNRSELLEWANSKRINVNVEVFSSGDGSAEATPGLSEALEAGGIFYRMEGADKASALASVVQVMRVPPDVDRDFLLQILLARESIASTGIGDGIAIPHVRNPIVLPVIAPMICLCFLERPIEFGAIDGQPVNSLFTVISPSVRVHLHLLSRLAFGLRDPVFKQAIVSQSPRDEILRAARQVDVRLASGAPQPVAEAASP